MGDLGDRIAAAVRSAATAGTPEAIVDALGEVRPDELEEFLHEHLAVPDGVEPIGEGLPASPGAASGRIVVSAAGAVEAGDAGDDVILVRSETTPDDVLGMQSSRGILTMRGGMVSHAAVVARGWGIPAVVGSPDVRIDGDTVTVGDRVLHVGDEITIDGGRGLVYAGRLEVRGAAAPSELDQVLRWADDVARGHVQVRVNADAEGDASHGRRRGAQGIGLCRTEHMFLDHDRLPIMRRFILSGDPATEAAALEELEAAQTADFERLLDAMDGLPVTVRLLDLPLHEFLPDLLDLTAREARGELDAAQCTEYEAARRLHESNPMIGTRGVRLGVVRSGLYEMQVRALCDAAARLFERGKHPHVEIMIPLVVDAEELRIARSWVTGVLDEIGHPELAADVVTVGAMIETPRAAITAGALAEHADFFSFGTNDLTQMTYAFSRDDVEARLLPAYQQHGILPANPFAVLDQDGVGELVRIACHAARATKAGIKLGACGEHAGHPDSADFLVRLGVDSVSCSPFRVPMARLGVAQALLACGRVHLDDVEFGDGSEWDEDRRARAVAETHPDVRERAVDVDVDEAVVLHTLRIRGFVTPEGFAASLGTVPTDLLDALVGAGEVRHLEARNMYSLSPAGRTHQEELLDDYAGAAVREALHEHYQRFLLLDDRFKQLCTDWQTRGDERNDHSDAGYDAACVARLEQLAADAIDVIDAVGAVVPRLRRYLHRLRAASENVASGDITQFTGVMCESFHDIWMELHEDLVVLQGVDRVKEGSF